MSVIRPRLPADPLLHDAKGRTGSPWDPAEVSRSLTSAYNAIAADLGELDLARRLLAEYSARRPESRLSAILAVARQVRQSCDRLVVVAGSSMAAATRLLVASCCHPFHDQLPRGDRGARPRLTWLDAVADHDRLLGLLDLVAPEGRPASSDIIDQWAIVAVDSSAAAQSVLATTQILAASMARTGSPGQAHAFERLVAVAGPGSAVADFVATLGCDRSFLGEPHLQSRVGVFTAAALLPAAIAGIDIVRLLEGAAAMLVRFTEAPLPRNPVLVDAAFRDHAARESDLKGNVFVDGPALSDLSEWGRSIRPVPREAASVVTRVVITEPRRGLRGVRAGSTVTATSPGVTIRLARLDEHSIGQLLQFMILSAAVEERLRESV